MQTKFITKTCIRLHSLAYFIWGTIFVLLLARVIIFVFYYYMRCLSENFKTQLLRRDINYWQVSCWNFSLSSQVLVSNTYWLSPTFSYMVIWRDLIASKQLVYRNFWRYSVSTQSNRSNFYVSCFETPHLLGGFFFYYCFNIYIEVRNNIVTWRLLIYFISFYFKTASVV